MKFHGEDVLLQIESKLIESVAIANLGVIYIRIDRM
jgi:hypothetical protein